MEKSDQLTDGVVAVLGMAKWELVVDFVLVAASVARLRQVAGLSPLIRRRAADAAAMWVLVYHSDQPSGK